MTKIAFYWRRCGVFFEDGDSLIAWIHRGFTPTFAQIAADRPTTGLIARITRVSFQPFVNPIIKLVKNVAVA